MSQHGKAYADESTPLATDLGRRHPMVVFGDHKLCAGRRLDVQAMPSPHMHSQVELNFVLEGAMRYWFDGRTVELGAGALGLFWGMAPHRVTHAEPGTTFACFYIPVSLVLGLPKGAGLRETLLGGGVAEAKVVQPHDRAQFLRWREELLAGDPALQDLVRDELLCRLRRIDREGWRDLRADAPPVSSDRATGADRIAPIERMYRCIGERGGEDIDVGDVAKAAGLHPNYAMQLFKRAAGVSIKQAIIRHRLDAAQSMLIASDRPVSQIAFDCGFGSLSSFYEAFEKRFRASPSELRRTLKGPERDARPA